MERKVLTVLGTLSGLPTELTISPEKSLLRTDSATQTGTPAENLCAVVPGMTDERLATFATVSAKH